MTTASRPPATRRPRRRLNAPPRPGGCAGSPLIGIVVAGLIGLLVIAYLASSLGVSTLVIGSLLALVPLAVVLLAVRWIDRWEPEPRWALWFAFLWGAAVSVAIALVVDLGVQLTMAFAEPGGSPDEAVQAVVQAPLVEESAKGIGVLLIYAFSRSHFDGPVDGLVYAATVAAGFAFTENILYFGDRARRGRRRATSARRSSSAASSRRSRTCCSRRARASRSASAPAAAGERAWSAGSCSGLAGAVLLHALWNGSLAFADDAIGLYFTVQVPIFIAAVLLTVLLRRQEVRVTRRRLGEYAAAGWFSPAEVEMLATPAGRRQARAWARAQTPPRTALMRRLITDATHLAFTRQRSSPDATAGARRRRARAAAAVAADRAALLR